MGPVAAGIVVLAAIFAIVSPARADVAIAVVGPMTGPYSMFGEQMRRGAEQAVADLNLGGGVLGSELELKIEDDRCDPRLAVTIANFLPGDEVSFVVGHFCSAASIPASKIYEEEGIIQISPAPGDPKLTDERGNGIFRIAGREDRQAELAAQVLAHYYKEAPIAILSNGSAYGMKLAIKANQYLVEQGIEVAMFEQYEPALTDYSELVEQLHEAGIAAIYFTGSPDEAGIVIRQGTERGFLPQIIGGDMLAVEEYWAAAGKAGEGTIVTYPLDPRTLPDAEPVVARFRSQQFEPQGVTLYTYAAIEAWAQAANAAGTLDTKEIILALHRHRFSTVLGDIVFDRNGDINLPGYAWYRWSEGVLTIPGQQER
jgi:branched-chain amino acid transport system substrate-binding protein